MNEGEGFLFILFYFILFFSVSFSFLFERDSVRLPLGRLLLLLLV